MTIILRRLWAFKWVVNGFYGLRSNIPNTIYKIQQKNRPYFLYILCCGITDGRDETSCLQFFRCIHVTLPYNVLPHLPWLGDGETIFRGKKIRFISFTILFLPVFFKLCIRQQKKRGYALKKKYSLSHTILNSSFIKFFGVTWKQWHQSYFKKLKLSLQIKSNSFVSDSATSI